MILFQDENLQNKFDNEGFVILELLDSSKVKELIDFYALKQDELNTPGPSFYSSSDINKDEALVLEIDHKLKDMLLPELNRFLSSFDAMMSTFLVKKPGENSEISFHQDLTLVDESKYVGANLWLALQDITKNNGAMTVIPGSHSIMDSIRASPTFPVFFEDYRDDLKRYAKAIELKPGQAILFNHRLIHGSTENLSKNDRLSVIMNMKSKGAQWLFYYAPEDANNIEKYSMNFNSYYRMQKNERPDAELLENVPYHFPALSKKAFEKALFKHQPNRLSLTNVLGFFRKKAVKN